MKYSIGVDIGGTNIRLAVVDENEFELNLSPTGFRGITKSVDANELL